MKNENKGRDFYREQQKKFKQMRKESPTYAWISKLPDRVVNGKVEKNPLNKGRTFIKSKEGGENNGNS